MLLFRGGDEKFATLTQEQQNAHMKLWDVWEAKTNAQGGNRLLPGGNFLNEEKIITDGPFSESKEVVGGYVILSATDLNEATTLSKNCPIFETGGTIEIREIM